MLKTAGFRFEPIPPLVLTIPASRASPELARQLRTLLTDPTLTGPGTREVHVTLINGVQTKTLVMHGVYVTMGPALWSMLEQLLGPEAVR